MRIEDLPIPWLSRMTRGERLGLILERRRLRAERPYSSTRAGKKKRSSRSERREQARRALDSLSGDQLVELLKKLEEIADA